jgi:hypothetical protein
VRRACSRAHPLGFAGHGRARRSTLHTTLHTLKMNTAAATAQHSPTCRNAAANTARLHSPACHDAAADTARQHSPGCHDAAAAVTHRTAQHAMMMQAAQQPSLLQPMACHSHTSPWPSSKYRSSTKPRPAKHPHPGSELIYIHRRLRTVVGWALHRQGGARQQPHLDVLEEELLGGAQG